MIHRTQEYEDFRSFQELFASHNYGGGGGGRVDVRVLGLRGLGCIEEARVGDRWLGFRGLG